MTIAIFNLVFGFGGTPLGGRKGEMEKNSQCKESNYNTDPKAIVEKVLQECSWMTWKYRVHHLIKISP